MKLIKPYYKIEDEINGYDIIEKIEKIGRTCYKSEDKICEKSAENFVKMILNRGHESVLEHVSFSVRFICDRGVSHELVRHRLASFSQESTRYCNYSKNNITYIIPQWINISEFDNFTMNDVDTLPDSETNKDTVLWLVSMLLIENCYNELINDGLKPEQARAVLPNSLKTEIVISANLREWRLIFKQRTAKVAHPQMRELMVPLCKKIKELIPIVFDDIEVYDE